YFLFAFAEEYGWRRFLLPHLLTTFSPLAASTILGTIWALWHIIDYLRLPLPLWTGLFTTMLLISIAQSIIYTYLFLHSHNRLWPIALAHAASNTGAAIVTLDPYNPELAIIDLFIRGLTAVLFLLLAYLYTNSLPISAQSVTIQKN
ncbi:MAG TPA: CPBP family intramembrane glutamic endopeptidase, partial [Anaerolineae bacterium]|nr:CPBP family intramembrane glutamic endopeptidase [Anaerolineae bacterium]